MWVCPVEHPHPLAEKKPAIDRNHRTLTRFSDINLSCSCFIGIIKGNVVHCSLFIFLLSSGIYDSLLDTVNVLENVVYQFEC